MGLSKIVAYNVQYGDCILLIFQNNNEKYMLLVDFGTRIPKIKDEKKDTYKAKWKYVSEKIIKEMDNNGVDKLDFLLTHFHEDHYNGLGFLEGKIDKVYTGTNLLTYKNRETLKSVLGIEARMKCIQKGIETLHTYKDGTKEEINILWPIKTIKSDLYKDFISDNFPGECETLDNEKMYSSIRESGALNYTSVVFEAQGVDGGLYLFTGDLGNDIPVYHTPTSKYLQPISDDELNKMRRRYKFIKVPHHGVEAWPIKEELLNLENGILLISWGATRDKEGWSVIYDYQDRIYATNVPSDFKGGIASCGDGGEVIISIQ